MIYPRFLPEVLRAIQELRECSGSSIDKIVGHIQSTLKDPNSFSSSRNLSTQVKRALKHAVDNAIVEERSGKFKINADLLDPYKGCTECRRRKRMEKAKRRRRRRKRKEHPVASNLDSNSESESERDRDFERSNSDSEGFPVSEARRRGRKKRKQRRRRRRRKFAEDK